MRDASGHNYRNSSFIVDVAVGQIPRSIERISSLKINYANNITVPYAIQSRDNYTIALN